MHDRDGWIWYDGQLVEWRSATTHVLTHSLHYGVAVFEGLRAYRTWDGRTCIFRLAEHTRRLFTSAKAYRMLIPFSAEVLEAAQRAVVRVNALETAYIRPLVFYGSEKLGVCPRGARVRVAVAAWSWDAYFGAAAIERGIRVKTSSFTRPSVNALLPRAKISANYANSVLANLEATEDGYDEALLLDADGFVAEGSGENLFVVKDARLYQPALASLLPGITRDTLVTLASDLGYRVEERRLTRDDVYLADEAFFTGTAAEIVPIVELDRRTISDGRPGPITRRLREAYQFAVTGRDPRYADWLTPVFETAPSTLAESAGAFDSVVVEEQRIAIA